MAKRQLSPMPEAPAIDYADSCISEGHMELLLVNARHLKTVPGRKTDVKDGEWIAQLMQ